MKKRIRNLLENSQFADIAERATARKRVLNVLVSLTFDAEPLIAWRAVEALGLAADRVADGNPDFVRGHLRRLHWFMSDEAGAVCWFAPQAMAEIVRRRPETFPDYLDIVVSLIHTTAEEDLAHFLPGILWAIGTVAPLTADNAQSALNKVGKCLDHGDSQVRGMAVWCLRQMRREKELAGREHLRLDDGVVEIYANHRLETTTVRELLGS